MDDNSSVNTVFQSRHISAISEGITKEVQKLILILDQAARHYRSSKVKKHLEESKGVIRVEYLPKGSPGLSAVEECWRKGKEKMNFLYQGVILNFEI